MTLQEAKILLDRFYDGLTTLDEERRLRQFVSSAACPASWAADRAVLLSVGQAAAEVPEDLDRHISAALSRTTRRVRPLWRRLMPTISIAAAVLVMFSIGLTFWLREPSSIYVNTCDTPREAAIQTREALTFVSDQLGMSFDALPIEDGPQP